VVEIEKLGKPGVLIDCSPFLADSKSSVVGVGMPDLKIVALSVASTSGRSAEELTKVAQEATVEIVNGLTKDTGVKTASAAPSKPKPAALLSYTGKNYAEALNNMEKFFLANRWSDGLPLVPPTPAAVEEMVKATGLPRDQVVGIVDPRKGIATVERIAINAVMAGARPAYMPLLITIVQALTDPAFDLYGVQCTGGLAAPLVIVSGPIIKDLNLNFSYSTAGPGWRSNSTIGRAMRLILINLGQAWPGVNDMKDVGNPAKFGIVIAENETQTPSGWPTIREQEGFGKTVSTVSVYASQSYRQMLKHTLKPYIEQATVDQMKTALNAEAGQWGEEMVFVFSPSLAEVLAKNGFTPEKIQRDLYERGRVPRKNFGPRPLGALAVANSIPKWIDDLPDDGLVPVVPRAEDIKVLVAGGRGPGASFVIDRWGFGNSRFVTKEVKLPSNWKDLLKDLSGWETPIEVK
jgi:hypothetical protein